MNGAVAVIYCMMCLFDFAVLASTVYMIQFHGWDAWWILFAVAVMGGSNPKFILSKKV